MSTNCNSKPDTINGLAVHRVAHGQAKVELRLTPETLQDQLVEKRRCVGARPENPTEGQCKVEKLNHMVQIKAVGDAFVPMFRAGYTMHEGATVERMRQVALIDRDLAGQQPDTIATAFFDDEKLLRVVQYLEPTKIRGTLRAWTSIWNDGSSPVAIDHLSSFVVSGMTPFAPDDAPGRLFLHRFKSRWSNEGKHVCESLEDLHLIRCYEGSKPISERFGQIGTKPVNQYFPFAAIEDRVAGVFWGAQLAWAGSWQIEIARRSDTVALSGGLADYEFGHWRKTIQPGECLTTPSANLACVQGTFDDLTQTLVQLQESQIDNLPDCESELPVVFNDWCTNWGDPSHEKTLAIAKRLQGSGVRYIVVDDGWAERPKEATMQANGDWIVDREKFPQGMRALCDKLWEMGFVPGIWMEFEVCNPSAKVFAETTHLLQRDGCPLEVGDRRFWDFNDPWVRDFIDERVIRFLAESGFGYLKVDYNETLGLGCDHPESLGEGLRQQVLGTYLTFDRIREGVPNLVIENCSSGGHRLEPSMMSRTSMSSFSDAHEAWHLPIIARQLHHLIPPKQSQIWAVLKPADNIRRIVFSLTATFYGRMCLSGPIHDLTEAQMEQVRMATAIYEKAAPIIREGRTSFLGQTPEYWVNPDGWTGVLRVNRECSEALIVVHRYIGTIESPIQIKLPETSGKRWELLECFVDDCSAKPKLIGNQIDLGLMPDLSGCVLLLKAS